MCFIESSKLRITDFSSTAPKYHFESKFVGQSITNGLNAFFSLNITVLFAWRLSRVTDSFVEEHILCCAFFLFIKFTFFGMSCMQSPKKCFSSFGELSNPLSPACTISLKALQYYSLPAARARELIKPSTASTSPLVEI